MCPRSCLAVLALVATRLPALAFADPPATGTPSTAVRPDTKIDDPMLVPPPPARHQVASWEQAQGLLRARSTDLRSAEAAVEQSEGRSRQALAALLPNAQATAAVALDLLHPDTPVTAGGGGPGAGAPGSNRPTAPLGTLSVGVSQSLVDVGAWRGVSSARAAEDGARATLKDVQRRLTQGLARTLVATVAAERAAELNRVGLRQALERAALSRRSFELGAANQLDVVRVEQDVEVTRETLVAGDEQVWRAREALGVALGADHGVGVAPSFQLGGLVAATQTTCAPVNGISQRADLVPGRAQVESARKSREQASAGRLPTLDVQSNAFGYTTTPGLGRVATWNIAAVLSVPLYEGGRRGGLVRERVGAEKQATEAFERTRREATMEVERGRRGVHVADSLVKVATSARDLAERTDQLTRRAFEVGRGSSLELVQSGAALRRAELSLALREFELVQARLDAFLTEARCDW